MKLDPHWGQTMQRVKVGVTGLAIVLLMIALASVVLRSANRERATVAPGASRPELVENLAQANTAEAANEPLAEIGAAPSGQANDSTPASTPVRRR